MKVIAMVHTTVPMEIEVDDKFLPLAKDASFPEEEELSSELLEVAGEALPESAYFQELSLVKSLDDVIMAEW